MALFVCLFACLLIFVPVEHSVVSTFRRWLVFGFGSVLTRSVTVCSEKLELGQPRVTTMLQAKGQGLSDTLCCCVMVQDYGIKHAGKTRYHGVTLPVGLWHFVSVVERTDELGTNKMLLGTSLKPGAKWALLLSPLPRPPWLSNTGAGELCPWLGNQGPK